MFAAMIKRAAALAATRAEARRAALAIRLAEALPPDVLAQDEAAGVVLSGRNLRRRLALDSRLGRLIAGAIK